MIEHNGRHMAVACREALTWLDGIDKPARVLNDDCVYVKVGTQIPKELMWRQDKELQYRPLAPYPEDLQVADVMDVLAEAPIDSPLQIPTYKTSPELLKTLHWIKNTLDDGQGDYYQYPTTLRFRLGQFDGCQVTFVQNEVEVGANPFAVKNHTKWELNFRDLDPSSIVVNSEGEAEAKTEAEAEAKAEGKNKNEIYELYTLQSTLTLHTTDSIPAIKLILNDWDWKGGYSIPVTNLGWYMFTPYVDHFAKALKHAITLCGGKRSTF